YVCSGADGSTVILQQEGPRLFLTERVSSDALVVTQSPDVSVQEGETGNITCCWKGAERVGIKWLKNQTLIENKTVINQSTGSKNEQKNKCSVLIIENMTTGDSGRYICKVSMEIPVLKEVEGKGTTITVIARENITKSTLEGLCNVTSNLQRSSCVFGLFAVIL
uniref:Ig-like domain-containing protein n=1 Tax=Xiphophorus couchianus TaxID=32473 RepID=A0A3B5MMA6_9TELE